METNEKCRENGDPYLFCEGQVSEREACADTLCSAHWGAWVMRLALGLN